MKVRLVFLVVNSVKLHLLQVTKADLLINTTATSIGTSQRNTSSEWNKTCKSVGETQPLSLLSRLMIRSTQTRSRHQALQ